jgi:hypothetical protein
MDMLLPGARLLEVIKQGHRSLVSLGIMWDPKQRLALRCPVQ